MQYLCLVCLDSEIAASLSKAQWKDVERDSLDYDDVLRSGGNYVTSSALKAPETARTIRIRDGRRSLTDGPYVETKEHVAGFILIEAENMDDAMEKAAGIPLARIGSIEVRELVDIAR